MGTSASMSSVRFCSLTAGDRRATRPVCTVGSPSTVTRTGWPTAHARGLALGHRRAAAAAGACARGSPPARPAARYSPDARPGARLTAPSIGEATTVSASCWRASSSSERRWSEHGLAVADLLERVLVAALGHLKRRHRGVELRPGDRAAAPRAAPAGRAVSWAWSSTRPRLAHDRGLLGVDAVVVAVGRKPEPGARLLQGRDRLVHAVAGSRSGRGARSAGPAGPGCRGRRRSRRAGRRPWCPGRPAPRRPGCRWRSRCAPRSPPRPAPPGPLEGRRRRNRSSVFFGDAVAGTSC